jgi:hypothetical protein
MEYLRPSAESLTRLAAALADQLPRRLVNDLDYVTMATGAFDPIESRQYYEKAIRAARTPYYRILARRGYGSYLFASGDDEGGANQFSTAISELTQAGDEGHAMRCDLYGLWAFYEQKAGHAEAAQDKSERAQYELNQIQNQALRREYSYDPAGTSRPRQPQASRAENPDGEQPRADSQEATTKNE